MENIQKYTDESLDIYIGKLPINTVGLDNPNILLSDIVDPIYIKKPITYIPHEISKDRFTYLITKYASYIDFIKCDYICLLCAYFNLTQEFKMYFIPTENNIYISTYYASINNNKTILEFIKNKNYYPREIQCALLETDRSNDLSNLTMKDIVKFDLHRIVRKYYMDIGSIRLLSVKYCAFRTFNEINKSLYLYIPKRPFTLKLAIFIREVIGHNPNLIINYVNDHTYTFTKDNVIVPEYIIIYMQIKNIKFVELSKIDIDYKLFNLGRKLITQFIKSACYDRTFIHTINFKIPFFNKYIEYGY